ncbi:hypothetical protein A8B82_09400 [Sulfitobacter sp. EhC04]|uniref:hypothetical protein n=1 Tax=Sulfitobacter sp. EhC04 TaxID=1849168 RepID=UPI0007F533BF|nr:hypothetical protein [Sulfitobacter sp. EhC04]OAN78576.1 hypothetical protein A8B82_09400 [Sulfitobacter sp. EhC04]
MGNFGETLAGRGGFCLCHLGFSLPMITLLRSNQSASGKIRLARVAEDEYPQALVKLRQKSVFVEQ